jgi:two-component system phosphate regulon sensor histidine kinase PhoR
MLPLSVLDGLPDAALVIDGQGHLVTGNAAAQTIGPVLAGRPLITWNRSPQLLAAADKARSTRTQQRCNIRIFAPVERSLDVSITPADLRAHDQSDLLLISLHDLTEQERIVRLRADFVANASHELRTPLAALRGFIETLQGAAKNDAAAQANFLGIMQEQAERMSRLIDDLLSLSRIEMREHVVPTGQVDLTGLVNESIGALRALAERSKISINFTPDAQPALAIGDRDELAQVLQNLIQNGIKYGHNGGKIDVSVRRDRQHIVIEVVDDGIGIAPEHLPRLTERFYRVSAKDSKDRGGTGLGLAIVKHIVNRHRGELRITSTLGKGSTFKVILPASSRLT